MKIRRLVFPDTEWYSKRPVRSTVNLTRPGLAAVLSPALLVVLSTVFALTADGRRARARALLIVIGLAALVVTILRIRQRGRPGEAMLFADDARLRFVQTSTGRLTAAAAVPAQVDPGTDPRIRLEISWDEVLATAATPTGAAWWAWRRPRLHVDLFVAPDVADVVTDDMRAIVVDVDPPAIDLPSTRLRFTIPRFSQQSALNLLRWYSPHLLVDPATGGSALFLEPDGDPWPDVVPETPGSRRVPIPPGPILMLPSMAVPVTEWAPPEPMPVDAGRPEFESAAERAGAPSSAGGPVPLRARPPHVAVFGHLGRITGAGRAWRVGWLVARLLMALGFLLLFVVLGIVGLTTSDLSGGVVVVSVVFTLWFGLGVWRYSWRLLRLRDAAASFVALTPGGVRVVGAESYASIPWRVIRQATLHTEGRRRWLCLGIDATAPADVSWAILRAPTTAQVLPGRTVLWLRLPKDEADPHRLADGVWVGGNVPFNAGFWPGPVGG